MSVLYILDSCFAVFCPILVERLSSRNQLAEAGEETKPSRGQLVILPIRTAAQQSQGTSYRDSDRSVDPTVSVYHLLLWKTYMLQEQKCWVMRDSA